ncbi:SURF1 family protein [Legionella tunisiensis]|uniref:SURF1 family protein n=1 Tax=Legionella tunisiensis TaxID=1034944 RepID=UPI0002F48CAB
MVSLTCFNRRFTPDWRMTILALLAIVLFVRLGFWQVARAEEKKRMLAAETALASQSPILWQTEMLKPQQYQPIRVKGHYLPDILLLDNQHYQHQFGYNVLTLFKLDSGRLVLIDRGWIKGNITRRTFPQIVIPTGPMHLTGRVYYPAGKNWILGPSVEKKAKRPLSNN